MTPILDISAVGLPLTCERQNAVQTRCRKVVDVVVTAIVTPGEARLRIIATTPPQDFWYKVFFFTRYGVLRTDTARESLELGDHPRYVCRSEKLREVLMDELMQNWQQYGIWPDRRPLGTQLLALWQKQRQEVLHG